jgi:hypothetical protein
MERGMAATLRAAPQLPAARQRSSQRHSRRGLRVQNLFTGKGPGLAGRVAPPAPTESGGAVTARASYYQFSTA